jgi:hypothetical protein
MQALAKLRLRRQRRRRKSRMVKVVLFPGGRQTPMRVNLGLTTRGALSRHTLSRSAPTETGAIVL